MVIFTTTLTKMLELFSFILIGYILRKGRYFPEGAGEVLASLETGFFMPAFILHTFATQCTGKNLREKADFILWESAILFFTILIATLVAKILTDARETEKIFRYALVVPNFAFMGNVVVESALGNDMLYDYMVLTMPLNIFAYTVGVVWLTPPKGERKKYVTNFMVLPVLIGIAIGMLKIPFPAFLNNATQNAGNCMAPVAMILTGYMIGEYRLKKLLTHFSVYTAIVLRLILIPMLVSGVLNILGVDIRIRILAVCALAMPVGLNAVILPAVHHQEAEEGAAMIAVSHFIAVITIPMILTAVMY